MKPEDIENMPAGREMDALVAEKVMGWKWLIGVANLGSGPKYRYLDEPHVWNPPRVEWDGKTEMPINHPCINTEWEYPEYSADIAAAWEVVEKLRELYRSKAFKEYFDAQSPWHWCFLRTDVFCLQVCRAALLAVTQENGEESECMVGGHPPGCRGHIKQEDVK